MRWVDALLRGGPAEATLGRCIACVVGGGAVYGAVMGTFGGFEGDRPLQIAYSAVKVPMLLGITFLLTLPSFFVLNTVLGLRADFGDVLRAVGAAQAGVAAVLTALAPYTALWYLTSGNYQEAILFNAAMFAVASLTAQALVQRHYRPLVARNPRHRWLMRAWVSVYAFVGVQMGWVLRPFVGSPEEPTRFFRQEAWGNAYVIVAEMIAAAIRGRFGL
ncbi:MAG: hypothetical protein U0746_03410 [Gemmataceae bacterium]